MRCLEGFDLVIIDCEFGNTRELYMRGGDQKPRFEHNLLKQRMLYLNHLKIEMLIHYTFISPSS